MALIKQKEESKIVAIAGYKLLNVLCKETEIVQIVQDEVNTYVYIVEYIGELPALIVTKLISDEAQKTEELGRQIEESNRRKSKEEENRAEMEALEDIPPLNGFYY